VLHLLRCLLNPPNLFVRPREGKIPRPTRREEETAERTPKEMPGTAARTKEAAGMITEEAEREIARTERVATEAKMASRNARNPKEDEGRRSRMPLPRKRRRPMLLPLLLRLRLQSRPRPLPIPRRRLPRHRSLQRLPRLQLQLQLQLQQQQQQQQLLPPPPPPPPPRQLLHLPWRPEAAGPH